MALERVGQGFRGSEPSSALPDPLSVLTGSGARVNSDTAAAAAALHGRCLSGRYWLRAACQRRATLDVRRDIGMWQPSRCRRQRLR